MPSPVMPSQPHPPPPPPPLTKRRQTLIGNHPICTFESMEDLYEPLEIIGTGSFGVIRKVRRRLDGLTLARKELNYGRMDERDLKQLTEEVNILSLLSNSPYIVKYHERYIDKPNNMLYILMEYCEGGDLAGVIGRGRRTGSHLPEELIWSYMAQLSTALHDCHSEVIETPEVDGVQAVGKKKMVILHRDIKPENVFLDKDANLKLGDFGLSKAMHQAAMTQTYVGTPYYMSPELINGMPYDVKSDIWALGCLIYELCAGHPPFHEARTQPELAVMIREGKIPDLPKVYSPHLGQVVRAMLKQNPKHRPNTSQIKALDSVKLQIRILEVRAITKELRQRDLAYQAREAALVARETVVLQREQEVVRREAGLRGAMDGFRDQQQRWQQQQMAEREEKERQEREKQERERQERERQDCVESGTTTGTENCRPQQLANGDVLARVASRPSLVPQRRPLIDERRNSNVGTSLPFPRLPSSSSLMSLDDATPIKERLSHIGRRLTTKSMADLSSVARGSPTGSAIDIDLYPSPSVQRSPTRSFRRSESRILGGNGIAGAPVSTTPLDNPVFDLSALPSLPTSSNNASSNSLLPTPPHASATLSTNLPRTSSFKPSQPSPTKSRTLGSLTNATPPKFSPDDLPSPFIKKVDGSRFPSAANGGNAAGTAPAVARKPGGRPSMASRLLATRAHAQAGVDEVGRRLSGVASGHGRGKSTG